MLQNRKGMVVNRCRQLPNVPEERGGGVGGVGRCLWFYFKNCVTDESEQSEHGEVSLFLTSYTKDFT